MTETLSIGQPVGGIMQVAYVVPDIGKAMAHWSGTLGVGPFFLFEHFALEDYRYRGKPGELDITLAIAFSGNMSFELIVQHSTGPSVYTEVIESRGYGFHHWGVSTKDFDATLARYQADGYDEALYGRVPAVDGRAAYVDTMENLGGMIELVEINPAVEDFFEILKAPSVNWDGRDPVRTLG